MPLGIHLTVFDRRNYVPLSFAAGFVLGMLPGLGLLGAMVGGFLYSYLSWWFGRSPRDPWEGAKRGATMGAAVGGAVSTVWALFAAWGLTLAMHPTLWFVPVLALLAGLAYGAIIGAILGGIGGLMAAYID